MLLLNINMKIIR